MNEVEIKIAEAIKELVRLLVPMATTYEDKHQMEEALDCLREGLIRAVGSRVIKGTK